MRVAWSRIPRGPRIPEGAPEDVSAHAPDLNRRLVQEMNPS